MTGTSSSTRRRSGSSKTGSSNTRGSSSSRRTTEYHDKPVYIKALSKEHEKIMLSRGVPSQDMIPSRLTLDVAECLVKIEQDFPYKGIPSKVISVSKQYRALQSIMENPLRGSYSIGISSFPSDARAKYLALMIMAAGIASYANHRRPGRSMPLWHRVYGGLGDPLRDKPIHDMPSMLIISNVNDNSSNLKLEKVRDLLEKFSDIPRIVVLGGLPPCNLFASKLFSPMRLGFYIGPSNMVKEI